MTIYRQDKERDKGETDSKTVKTDTDRGKK